jgi:predicted ATPase/DNA-binding CsgD family transcriptional regulator
MTLHDQVLDPGVEPCGAVEPGAHVAGLGHPEETGMQSARGRPPKRESGVRTPCPPLHHLPAQSTRLIGRDREVSALRRAVLSDDVRLLTICGPAGIGKTRLAVATATSLLGEVRPGIVFVDLAPISDPALVAAAVADALNVRLVGDLPALEQLRNYLKHRHVLLVLDNFEQVLGAAAQLAELLAACPALKLLVTSREPLHLSWEHEYPVPPLGLPDLRCLPAAGVLTDCPAVALFLERARVVNPSFVLTAGNAAVVAELCVRLDGLPLAIELAAARSKVLPPQAILARLQQRLDLLASSVRDRPRRHHTLRAALDWSYELLGLPEQALFRALAVFVGGCTLEAAEAVSLHAGSPLASPSLRAPVFPSSILDGITSLVDKSLLRLEQPMASEPRFGMLEMVRTYALERLVASGEAEALWQRHADYFVTLAEQAEPELRGPNQVAWLERLEREHDNLRAALRWCLESGAAESGLRLGGALWRFWYVRGHFAEGSEWLARLLAVSDGSAPTVARAKALNGVGNLAWNQNEYDTAEACHTESLTIRRALGDEPGIAASLNNLGLVARHRAEYARAQCLFEDALARSRTLGDWALQALHLNNLANVLHDQGDDAAAPVLQEESLAIYTRLGSDWGIAMALCDLAQVVQAQGDVARAQVLCEQSLAIRGRIGDRRGLAQARAALGQLADDQEDYPAARAHFAESLALAREVGDRLGLAHGLEGLAAVDVSQGHAESALRLAGAAAALRAAIGAPCSPAEQARLDRRLGPATRAVGKERATQLWEGGRLLSPEQTTATGFGLPPAPESSGSGQPTRDPAEWLTPRERKTAALLARGLTNRQIAAQLVITEGTAKLHVKHILHKLGFSCRAQITAWALQRGLLEAPAAAWPL